MALAGGPALTALLDSRPQGAPAPSFRAEAAGAAGALHVGPPIAATPPDFWSLVLQTTCPNCITTQPFIGAYLNATPFTTFRVGQDSDQCNASADVQYGDNGAPMGPCSTNLSAYRSWCGSRAPHCESIVDLPAENNNSAEDAAIAQYIVDTVGFQPEYWAIGNEPMGWKHYGIPWSHWSVSDHSTPTPIAFAYDARAVIAAVRAVDPSARFIGIQGACECNGDYFQADVEVNGPNLSGIAYHTYPSTARSTFETLQQFYDPLASSTNITTSYAKVRASVVGHCVPCSTLPIFVTEYNAGPGWAPSNWGGTYANAVFLAASATQALQANVTRWAISDLQTYATSSADFSLMTADGTVRPPGLLFSAVLSHLAVGEVLGTQVRTPVSSVWAVVSRNASMTSLLLVNANLESSVSLNLPAPFFPDDPATFYQWSPATLTPRIEPGFLAPVLTVPPQGILLVDEPTGAAPLAAAASAIPAVVPNTVSFSLNTTGGEAPYRSVWGFGDGGASGAANVSHTYSSPGPYQATVAVTDATGATSVAELTVTFAPGLPALRAACDAGPVSGAAPLALFARCLGTGGPAPSAYTWTLGDGVHVDGSQVERTFTQAGTYRVSVQANESGAIVVLGSWNVSVAAGPPPVPDPAPEARSGGGLTYGLEAGLVAGVASMVPYLLHRSRSRARGPPVPPGRDGSRFPP
ncbi:MAG: PKD domain-containing protein [Thermoplasmata archaeon]|nr:PKD domain-containing protein [Thermoplasmata archaeon]